MSDKGSFEVGPYNRTYWHDLGKVWIQEKDGFGSVITHVVYDGNFNTAQKIFSTMRDLYSFGQRDKLKEIQNILGIRN